MREASSDSVEVRVVLVCWTAGRQCKSDVELAILNKIGTRQQLRVKNSDTPLHLTVGNVLLQPEDHEKTAETLFAGDPDHVLVVTATAGVVGVLLGLVVVGLGVMKTRPGLYHLYPGHSRPEDLHHITEDVTVIQGSEVS